MLAIVWMCYTTPYTCHMIELLVKNNNYSRFDVQILRDRVVSLSEDLIRTAYVSPASRTTLDIGFGDYISAALLAVKTGVKSVLTIPAFTTDDKYFRLDLTTDDTGNLSDVVK